MRTIGWLSLRSSDTERERRLLAAFREGLAQTGYVEGRNLTIELRFGDGQYDRLPALAADLVQRQVAVLVTTGGSRIRADGTVRDRDNSDRFCDRQRSGSGRARQEHQPARRQQHGKYLINNALAPKRLEVLQTSSNARRGRLSGQSQQLSTAKPGTRDADRRKSSASTDVLNASIAEDIHAAFASAVRRGADAMVMGADPFSRCSSDR